MDPEGSVTRWISLLKDGDRAAASPLWEAYFRRLVALSRDRLRGTPRRAADEEDVALAAFDSFYRRAERGKFPDLQDRDDLWRLLFVLTVRKAIDLARREARQPGRGARGRRSGSRPSGTSSCCSARSPPPSSPPWWPTSAGTCSTASGTILRAVAVWKMEGETNAEIAARLGVVVSTVERKLRRIRDLWDAGGSLMSDANPTEEGNRWHSLGGRMEAVCDRFEAAWKAGRRPSIEDHLDGVPEARRAAAVPRAAGAGAGLPSPGRRAADAGGVSRPVPAHLAVIDAVLGAAPCPRLGPVRITPCSTPSSPSRTNLSTATSSWPPSTHGWSTSPGRWDRSCSTAGRWVEQLRLLEALVSEHLKLHGGDPQKSLAALSSLGSTHRALEQVKDPDVQQSLRAVSAAR